MAVLSADVIFDNVRTSDRDIFQVINGDTVYQGGYTAIGGANHGTAATQGRALPWADDTGNLVPMGHALQQKLGDTSASPIPFTSIQMMEHTIENLAVTGAAGSFTDVPNLVYAVDDGNYTMTAPTTVAFPVGFCVRHRSAGYCDVLFFSAGTMAAMALCGGNHETVFLGVVTGGAGTGDALTGIKMNSAGSINSVYGIVIDGIVDADADLDFNLEIGTTNVTGGVIEWLTADVIAAKKAGTAVTAENVFHQGDLVTVECTANTASTAADPGKMAIYMDVTRFLGT